MIVPFIKEPNILDGHRSIPGVPGEDYPIFSKAPETGFSCEGKVPGGEL